MYHHPIYLSRPSQRSPRIIALLSLLHRPSPAMQFSDFGPLNGGPIFSREDRCSEDGGRRDFPGPHVAVGNSCL
jgi:hypothetical protein